MVCFLPSHVASFKDLGLDVAAAEPGRGAFRKLLPLVADDDDRFAAQARGPVLDVEMRPLNGARNQARIGREVLIDAHIDERRRGRRAYQSRQFVG